MDDFQIPENWDRKDDNGNLIQYDNFVNIHCHSYFSLLDGMSKPEDIVDKTYNMGQPASCISDHGVMFSLVDHFSYAKQKGQKAIAAFEAYVVGNYKERTNEGENARNHLLLIAKNKEGYKKLSYWCSVGCTDGFYYKPRIDNSVLESTGGDGVIACSACIGGKIPQHILNGEMDKAKELASYYNNLFEEFYLEIQPTMEDKQVKINMGLLEISRELNIPMVATSDSHYLDRSHAKSHEILLAIQTRKSLSDPDRWRFPGDTYFVASRKEMEEMFDCNGHEIFPKDELKKALDNTVKIANSCNFELELGKHYLPHINIPMDDQQFLNWAKKNNKKDLNSSYLRYLCIKGLKEKGLTGKEYRERLDYELKIINDMGFNDYFLIYEDIARFCNDNDIPIGCGRGCFEKNSKVTLANGEIKLIQDVLLGDIVKGHDEKPHKVITTFEYDCDEEITKLDIENNKRLSLTNDHKIYAIKKEDWNKGIREPQWYMADELDEGDYIAELD